MNEQSQTSRREYVRTVAGVGIGSAVGIRASGTVQAAGGDEIWRFETPIQVSSSPTVVDGTVFVGCRDANVYALDASDGTEKWRFLTGGYYSSPTVVSGTTFVGGRNVYALDAGIRESSKGSRVLLGTLGHHGDLRAGQPISFNESPTATISISPSPPRASESTNFNANNSTDPDGSITSYEWSIDGMSYTGETVEHTFGEAGEYTIELTVTDDNGATATETETLEVVQRETLDSQQSGNEQQTTDEVNDSDGGIPVLNRFLAYRRSHDDSGDQRSDQQYD